MSLVIYDRNYGNSWTKLTHKCSAEFASRRAVHYWNILSVSLLYLLENLRIRAVFKGILYDVQGNNKELAPAIQKCCTERP